MSKINVLVLPSDKSGVGKFRSVDPHLYLQRLYPEDFHVDINYTPDLNNPDYFKKYQIIHVHRSIGGDYEKSFHMITWMKNQGINVIVDLDDYWLPGKEHPIHHMIVQNKIHEKIMNNLKVAKYVTTTTKLFADEISKLNKNVVVFPNGIDPNDSQFKEPTIKSDKLRFGWLGGSSHLHDMKLIETSMSRLQQYNKNYQFYLCGFDTRGTVTEINSKTGEQKQRPIKPHETVWVEYEKIVTNNYNNVSGDYKKFLDTYKEGDYDTSNEPYTRVWTRPVTSYAKNYSRFDVSLAPLKNHIFNRMKSQLKVIEAGFYKKALIASEVGPYTIDIKHSIKNGEFGDGNGILINENRNHQDWFKYMKKLIDNPNFAYDLGERLYETVKDEYDINNITRQRMEWYKSIVN
jgi:glycosyltransferase involved in cell wall biosynthesis